MKHQYEDYIAWIDNEVKKNTNGTAYAPSSLRKISIASLLANKATLEKHREKLIPAQFFPERSARIVCSFCESWQFGKLSVPFPCPSFLDLTNQLDEVM